MGKPSCERVRPAPSLAAIPGPIRPRPPHYFTEEPGVSTNRQ